MCSLFNLRYIQKKKGTKMEPIIGHRKDCNRIERTWAMGYKLINHAGCW